MSDRTRPLVVVSDVHAAREEGRTRRCLDDLAGVVEAHPGAEIIFAGDVFDLSMEPRRHDTLEALKTLLRPADQLTGALKRHVERDGRVTFIPGNHDGALTEPEIAPLLAASLGFSVDAPVSVVPWFLRRGRIHVEHGHLYDRDNAPLHPLVWDEDTEPLGIALTRRFIAPSGADDFAHAHKTTPLQGFLDSWRLYGARAPSVITNYFTTAGALCIEAGPKRKAALAEERALGDERLQAFAGSHGFDASKLTEIAEAAPAPTHARRRDMFMRLYFDRVIATVLGTAGAGTARALGATLTAQSLGVFAVSYLALNILRSGRRYDGGAVAALRDAAERLAEFTDADLVIFGHIHEIDEGNRYLNSGSFAFPRQHGRPYIYVTEGGDAERRFATVTA